MYTECTGLFSLAQFANQIISMQNTYGQIDASLSIMSSSGQMMSGLKTLIVAESNAEPTIVNPKVQILETNSKLEKLRMKNKGQTESQN